MHPKLNRRYFLLLVSLLLIQHIPGSLCQNGGEYETCGAPFQCAGIGGISYPFYGGNRPNYCGYPGFQLSNCQGDVPILTISSIRYRVLEIDNTRKTVRVAREDLWNTTCPRFLYNTTLEENIFLFLPNDQNITLHYGCFTSSGQPIPLQLPSMFPCNVNRTSSSFFTLGGAFPSIPGFGAPIRCETNISVPVNETAARLLAVSSASIVLLQDALASGFSLQWSANNTACENCNQSGGVCGTNLDPLSFACYCANGPFSSTCNSAETENAAGSGKNKTGMNIGLSIAGAVLAGIGLGWLIFHYRQKKKQRLAAQSTETMSKDLLHPPSKSISTPPSATFTRSIPSYPSSKSDFGRSSFYFGVQVFSYSELEEATNNFDPSRELGDGGFGTVYYGVLADGRIVAVKRLYENNFKRVEQFMNEVEILTRLRHKNLVTLYGCTSKRSRELLLVYEYIPNGTVADHLHGKRSKSGLLSWAVRLNIAIETANALAYLHKSDIIHRDVKTNNILLDNDFHVKVADFGLSRLFPNDVTHVSTAPQGTPGYVDPEYYQCYQLTEKSDVYSFGVVLVELISSLQAVDTNRHRLDINLANMAVNKIQNHTLHELVDLSLGFETNSVVRRMATLVAELAFRCLQQERDMRPSMEEVLEVLRGIQSEDLNAHKVEVVDILIDDEVGPLKGSVAPSSPDSVVTDKSVSTSTPNSSG
ncbi:LEAF RUST 10 DISEASE-RESISTANCE LOCUS RECEPTOR-LIKE PROTEIN KINASE-like 1.3 isoform X3 [Olea europaea var. sylvestris]|uniref:LEAF RUST 10 DISEASE-RESISTANCE LOCUS RECEPTOR-LIKE PROTEIN KINASE-like 1.3 isoform X3 n=1 Tax=Olea europaea var. sylvestris TaxID=158386 RepID=UPI000C1D79A3|nr:LEAF RUST 10 DISEASE-RESISTANCE LOCUS RECEPTOR-LIKE PROTEIN KINASE-like 1.3 isoform X3 [Olea europaea var. sylvestris]